MHYRIAVGGATGNVGSTMLQVLAERGFPAARIVALASARSVGRTVRYGDTELVVEDLDHHNFTDTDLLFLSTGGEHSRLISPRAAAAGCVVIDNSSAFRLDPEVPLVVPEVNPAALDDWAQKRILPVANCSTIQLAVALKPLHDAAPITRVVVATYQSMSGGGRRLLEQLDAELAQPVQDGAPDAEPPYAHNVVPQIDVLLEDGRSKEEWKMAEEIRKIVDPAIRLSASCVRVPVRVGHAEAVHIEFAAPLSVDEARRRLAAAPGLVLQDAPHATPWSAAGRDPVYVSRLRRDDTVAHGLCLWIVADNIRKGAALNAVQIAEALIARPDFAAHCQGRQASAA
ncbi:aspartate-semialdehyde dehydrogenase [Neisseriaceae bacterium JH1-16]|nr:aspartate-semialdehyde dehydrogenase [Neisseriaceae bacterium JH1-16]